MVYRIPANAGRSVNCRGLPPFLLADAPGLVPKPNEVIMPDLQIEHTPIDALRAQRQNARTHSKRQIRQIADLIERFGFCNPILVDDDLTDPSRSRPCCGRATAQPCHGANGSAVASQRSR